MRAFEYAAPESTAEALELLAQHGDDAKVLAGGQSLVPLLNYRLVEPRVIVDINAVPLSGIGRADGRLRVGALTRHHTLEASPEIASACPVLRDAARLVGNVRVRTLGTVGGSLAHADPAAELPMVMVALDARFTLQSRRGSRTVPAGDFFSGYLTTALALDELLTEIEVPALDRVAGDPLPARGGTGRTGYAIEEHARRAGDFATVAVTAVVRLSPAGAIEDVQLAFGGVAPTPVRADGAERMLRGQPPTAEVIQDASSAAARGLDPQTDAFASADYRRLLARVLTRRALTRAVDEARHVGATA